MSPRPYWKGYLKLSLVSCPIAVHAACSSAERISFRQINRKTGNRLRQQLIDEETREVVEAHEKARGYEIGKGQYLLIEDDELEAIEIASTHTNGGRRARRGRSMTSQEGVRRLWCGNWGLRS